MLKLIALGGLGEIGLNMMVIEYKSTIIIIDSGLMFPENYMIGINYVIPKMDYLYANKEKIAAIILTHAHEDHIGAIPFFLKKFNVPVFATAFTLEIVKNKLKEYNLLSDCFLYKISPSEKLKIQPFEIEFIKVKHSVIDSIALAIETPVGIIIHTGDFKIDYNKNDKTNINTFIKYGEKNLLALLSDSTNVEKNGYTLSSESVIKELTQLTEKNKGRVIIALFSSNIDRIQQIVNIAKIKKRKIIFHGRSLELSVNVAKKLKYIKISKEMEISIEDINSYPDKEIMLITTGSQGEPMSALARMAAGTHKQIDIKHNDLIILSSKFIPGNEKAIANMINTLYKRGAKVSYEKIANIHTSGHAYREELKLMINITKPKFFIPIHGEYRHLVLHCKLARNCGIPEDSMILAQNGQIIELNQTKFKISSKVDHGRVLIDGKGIGDIGRSVLKARKILSEDGCVIINIIFDEKTGTITYGPEITSKGFIFETKTGYLLNEAKCIILEVVERNNSKSSNRMIKIKNEIQSLLRQYFSYSIGRKPVIFIFLSEI